MTAEEKAGLTPAVPLPENVVYRPFDEWLREEARKLQKPNSDSKKEELLEKLEPLPPSRLNEQVITSSSRPATQSFAAQQRARPQGSSNSSSRNVRSGQLDNQAQQSSRTNTESNLRSVIIPNRHPRASSRKPESDISEKTAHMENRLAADMTEQLNRAAAERRSQEAAPLVLDMPVSLFNPRERLEVISGTKPDHILRGLQRLQSELERALNSRSTALETNSRPPSPTIVVKWVDYTNKFGLGYILSNGKCWLHLQGNSR